MITPQAGYQVDPNNPNGVIKIPDATAAAAPVGGALPGASVSNQGKPGYDVFGNPVPGASSTSSTPTVGSIYSNLGDSPTLAAAYKMQQDNASTAANQPDPNDPAVQAQIRQQTLAGFQAEIDAQNSLYADKLASAKITGANRLGSTTAIEARRGLIGSDFGGAMTDKTNSANNDVYNSINDEKSAAISAILSNARTAGDKAIADKTAAKQAGVDNYVKYLSEASTRQKTNAQTAAQLLISQGHKVEDLKPEDLTALTSGYGITPEQLKAEYAPLAKSATDAATKLAQEKQAADDAHTKASQTTLSPGQTIVDASGKVIASVAPKDTYTVVKGTKTTNELGGESVSPDRVFDSTTGKFVGYTGSSSGSSSSNGSVTTPTSTSANLPAGNQTASTTKGTGSQGLDFNQYGLLANTDFNPTNPLDGLAQKYLDTYLKNGTVPTASTLGRGIQPAGMAKVDTRARDLYFKATGQSLPNPHILKAQQDIISDNYKLGNNLAIQEQNVSQNVDLSLSNMTKNGLNSSGFKPLDELLDGIKVAFQDPATNQLISQNQTLQSELGSLLAVKNAAGTTVHDKLSSAGIIQDGQSPEVIKQNIQTLLKEANIFANSIQSANATAYKFTDPLLQDANNPARQQFANKAFVDKALTAQGLDWQKLTDEMTAQVADHPGYQPALDAKTGSPVFATPDEIKSGKYISL